MTSESSQHELRFAASRWLAALVIACAIVATASRAANGATVDRYWEVSPYRVRLLVRYDTSAVWQTRLQGRLSDYLRSRVHVAYGSLWKLTIEQADVDVSRGDNERLLNLPEDSLSQTRRDFDKLIVLVVDERLLDIRIQAQEYDCLLEQWGPVHLTTTRDIATIFESAFATIHNAFTPMATFRVVRETPDQVELRFRGAGLPDPRAEQPLVSAGQVLRPYLRRVDRDGQPVDNGIQQVPWTYFSVNPVDDNASTAAIVSHTTAPLGIRQRGRVDQLAAVVRPSNRTTVLRLHARDDIDQPLAGFRVYRRDADAKEPAFLGKTKDDGSISIPPGATPIQVVFVQSSGQWIAKIPVVPNADQLIEAPLVDDSKRLEAEAKLVGIREELIDLVARRNILAARTRAKLKANDIDGARALVGELEQTMTATQFEQQRIRQPQRLIQSEDPRIQDRIENLFNDTRDVLSEFLAPGLIQQLKNEIAAAGSTTDQ